MNCAVTPTLPSSLAVLSWKVDGAAEVSSGACPLTALVAVDASKSGSHVVTANTRSKSGVASAPRHLPATFSRGNRSLPRFRAQ